MCLRTVTATLKPTNKVISAWKVLEPGPKFCYHAAHQITPGKWMKAKKGWLGIHGFHVLPTKKDAENWQREYIKFEYSRRYSFIVEVEVKRVFKRGGDEKMINGKRIPTLVAEYIRIPELAPQRVKKCLKKKSKK